MYYVLYWHAENVENYLKDSPYKSVKMLPEYSKFKDTWIKTLLATVKSKYDLELRDKLKIYPPGSKNRNFDRLEFSHYNPDIRDARKKPIIPSPDEMSKHFSTESYPWNAFTFIMDSILDKGWATHNRFRTDEQRRLVAAFRPAKTEGNYKCSCTKFDPESDTLVLYGHGSSMDSSISGGSHITSISYLKKMVSNILKPFAGSSGCFGNTTISDQRVKIILQCCYGARSMGVELSRYLASKKINNKITAYSTAINLPAFTIYHLPGVNAYQRKVHRLDPDLYGIQNWLINICMGLESPKSGFSRGPMTCWLEGKDVRYDIINGVRKRHYAKFDKQLKVYQRSII
ncbi:MAG: hypothetical protein GY750_16385 [Lentisphaerae bacterium]|nr:hypothetical protein [Lentisphaerota bacterium]MCP4102975.1 hypothetical protein [Lentisphaerota bacterium]